MNRAASGEDRESRSESGLIPPSLKGRLAAVAQQNDFTNDAAVAFNQHEVVTGANPVMPAPWPRQIEAAPIAHLVMLAPVKARQTFAAMDVMAWPGPARATVMAVIALVHPGTAIVAAFEPAMAGEAWRAIVALVAVIVMAVTIRRMGQGGAGGQAHGQRQEESRKFHGAPSNEVKE